MGVEVKQKEDFFEIFLNGKKIGLTYNPEKVDEIVKLYKKDPEKVKKCNRCGETKHVIMYYKRSKSPDGLQSYCIVCNHNWEPSVS